MCQVQLKEARLAELEVGAVLVPPEERAKTEKVSWPTAAVMRASVLMNACRDLVLLTLGF